MFLPHKASLHTLWSSQPTHPHDRGRSSCVRDTGQGWRHTTSLGPEQASQLARQMLRLPGWALAPQGKRGPCVLESVYFCVPGASGTLTWRAQRSSGPGGRVALEHRRPVWWLRNHSPAPDLLCEGGPITWTCLSSRAHRMALKCLFVCVLPPSWGRAGSSLTRWTCTSLCCILKVIHDWFAIYKRILSMFFQLFLPSCFCALVESRHALGDASMPSGTVYALGDATML